MTLSPILEKLSIIRFSIRKREAVSKRLSKYITAFDCFGKILIILSAAIGGTFIASFATAIGAPVRVATAIFSLGFV